MRIQKYIWTFFLLILIVFQPDASFAQKKKKHKKKKSVHVIEGDKHFALFDYVKAAEEYKKAYEKDPTDHYALYKLAESYKEYYDYYNAEKYYHEATVKALHEYPLSRYWYAIMLKDNGNYLQAKDEFLKFKEEYKAHTLEAELYKEKATQEAQGCDMALNELKKPQRDYKFKSLPVPVNSELFDYSVVITHNDSSIALTSARQQSKGKTESGSGGSLSDIYRFDKGSGDTWKEVHDHDGFNSMNTLFNESAGSFTADSLKFYFTRCDEKVKVGEFIEYNCAIYVTHKVNGKWEKPVKLNENVNLKGHYNAQPSISPDGHVLFFVSRRPGGLGMHDIWYSTCTGDDNWSKAINMGDGINTLFSEVSPRYYGKEKILFFSSNGREGFGGLDIFFVHEEKLDSIKNIGLPFNSNRDDQDFVIGEKSGYLSSNREGGIGSFDIYSFNIDSKESLIAYINNDTAKVNSISVVGKLTHEDTKLPASDVGVILADDESNKLKTSTTNEEGDFRFDNLSTEKNYKVLLEEDDAKITKNVKYIVDNVEVKKSNKAASKTLFDNIYFDFDKFDLKQESRKTLDKLVDFYKEHPEIQIEMSANTDSYGTSEYNKLLSKNRGNSALKYLISRGVDKSALVVNAEGEGKPVASNTSQVGRQLNRRVEFYILGGAGYSTDEGTIVINPKDRALYYVARQFNMSVEDLEKYLKYEKVSVSGEDVRLTGLSGSTGSNIAYYIVQPKNTLFSIARLYGMSLDELKELNGFGPAYVGPIVGQKVRVKVKNTTPGDGYYLVKEGDTLYSISKQYGLTVEELVKLNNLEGYILRKYMILKTR